MEDNYTLSSNLIQRTCKHPIWHGVPPRASVLVVKRNEIWLKTYSFWPVLITSRVEMAGQFWLTGCTHTHTLLQEHVRSYTFVKQDMSGCSPFSYSFLQFAYLRQAPTDEGWSKMSRFGDTRSECELAYLLGSLCGGHWSTLDQLIHETGCEANKNCVGMCANGWYIYIYIHI